MAKIVEKKEGTPTGAWMATFSDMNTLLLTFFVLLYSMGSLATDDFDKIFKNKKGDYLGLGNDSPMESLSDKIFDPHTMVKRNDMAHALNVFKSEDSLEGVDIGIPDGVEIFYSTTRDGEITIMIADRLLFSPGQVELTPESVQLLEKVKIFIRNVISVSPRRIIVEGHTDNSTPANEGYVISARRAEAVRLFLLSDELMPPELFSIVGYGASRPLAPNISDVNRAKNRRVRIYLEAPDKAARSNVF
jgi:chemotaxis protein MotB